MKTQKKNKERVWDKEIARRKRIFLKEAQKATFSKCQAEFLKKVCFDYPTHS